MKKIAFIALLLALLSQSISAQVLWKHATGGPRNGSTNSLTVDSLQRIYVCTGGDGVLQSTDHGVSWHGYNKGLRILPMRMLVSSSLGSLNGAAYVYGLSHRKELMRRIFNTTSTDNQWEYLDTVVNGRGTLDVNQMLTNRKGYLYLATSVFGVMRSKFYGKNFDQPNLKAPTPDSFIICMAIDRRNEDLYCVGAPSLADSFHVFHSTDDGSTWKALPAIPPRGTFVNNIVIADDGSICLGYSVNRYDSTRVYRSTDMGQSWKPVFWLPISHNMSVDAMIQSPQGHALYLNAHGPTYRSLDNGASWQVRNPNKAGEETFSLVADDSERLFQCAIPDGVFSSVDSGLTFINDSNMLVQHLDGGLAVDSKGDILTMSQFNVYYSNDQGNYWASVAETDEPYFPLIVTDKEDYFYYTTFGGIFRSEDHCKTFQNIVPVDSALNPTNQILVIAVSPQDVLWASIQHGPKGDQTLPELAFSKDHGTTWKSVNNSLSNGIPSNVEVSALGFSSGTDPNVDDTIYAAGNTNNIYRSVNSGINWDVVNTEGNGIIQFVGHPDGSVFRLQTGPPGKAGQPGDSGVLEGGLFRSLNGGKDWVKIFPSAAQNFVDSFDYFSLSVTPLLLDRTGKILVCTVDSGIFRSKNADFTEWENVSSGFVGDDYYPNKPLNCSQIVQVKSTGLYYANSRGTSVFIGSPDLLTLWNSVPPNPFTFSIAEPINYPNPFVRSTQIDFDVLHSGYIKLSVYDIMGRLIKNIFEGSLAAGKHSVAFDAMIPSGKYMVLLQSENDKVSHWMTVTK